MVFKLALHSNHLGDFKIPVSRPYPMPVKSESLMEGLGLDDFFC